MPRDVAYPTPDVLRNVDWTASTRRGTVFSLLSIPPKSNTEGFLRRKINQPKLRMEEETESNLLKKCFWTESCPK
jgi:hypothetical protein